MARYKRLRHHIQSLIWKPGLVASLVPPPLAAAPSGPALLGDLDYSEPVPSWTDGRTGFSSAFATHEWTITSTAYSGGYAANVGTESLVNTGGLTAQTAVGLYNGTDHTSLNAWEALDNGDYLLASGTTAGDSDSEDFCFRIVFRFPTAPANGDYLLAKRELSAGAAGWALLDSVGSLRFTTDDGNAGGNDGASATLTGADHYDGAWHYATGWYDQSAQMMYLKSDLASEVSAATTNLDSMSTSQSLMVNGFNGGGTSGTNGMQVAYVGVCVGANSESMYDETFWQHASDPGAYYAGKTALTTQTRASLISREVEAGYVGHFADDTLPIGYNAALTSGYALRTNSTVTNLISGSEDFSTWTAVSGIASETANYGDGPDRFRNSYRLVSNANNARFSKVFAASVSTQYTGSLYVKSSTGSNVAGKLQIRDGVTLTDAAFTATTSWQRFDVTHTTDASATGTSLNVYIDTSGDSIEIQFAQAELGDGATSYIRAIGGTASLASHQYGGGAFQNSQQGELKITGVLTTTPAAGDYLFLTANSASVNNMQFITLTASGQPDTYWYDNAGSIEDRITHTSGISAGTEFVHRMVWSTSGVGSSLESVNILDGVQEDGGAMPLEGTVNDVTADLFRIGSDGAGSFPLDGDIQRVLAYDGLNEALP